MKFKLNGKEVSRRQFLKKKAGVKGIFEEGGFRGAPSNWPLYSDALGCLPTEVPEQTRVLNEAGLHAEFDSVGRMKLESRGHRKKMCRLFGLIDRSGGYSDAT